MSGLAKGLVLAAVLLAVNSVLSDWYRDRVMWRGLAERTQRQFDERSDAIDTVILGDSHAKWGLQPSVLGNAFNFALPGEKYPETYYRLKQLIHRGDLELRFVVLQADLHSFASSNMDQFPFVHHYASFVDYWDIGWKRGSPLSYTARGLFGRFAPYVGQRSNILSYFDNGAPADLAWLLWRRLEAGALVGTDSDAALSQQERIAQARERIEFYFGKFAPYAPLMETYFVKILELCEANGIQVILVAYPVTREYLDAAAERIDVVEFDRRVDDLVAPFANVHRIRAREALGSGVDHFLDTDHLNRSGAEGLSRLIRVRFLDTLREDGTR